MLLAIGGCQCWQNCTKESISIEEVKEAVNEINLVRHQGWNPVECLMKGGMAVLDWLVRLLNASFDVGVGTYGLARCMSSSPVQRVKGCKCEYSNSTGICSLSVVG